LAAVGAFAGLAAPRLFAAVPDSRLPAVPDSRLAAVDLVTRFTGADPLADLAAVFLAGVLVAVRFTGSSVAGLAFVAATYTLSILQFPMGAIVHHRKRRLCRMLAVDLAAVRLCGRRRPL
jgi:hypothetical protein